MDRKEELREIVNNEKLFFPLIDQIVSLELELEKIEKLPMYKVNPANPEQQKILPAFKIYKELLQQYNNCIKSIARSLGLDDKDEESPLRQWARNKLKGDE